MRVITGRFKGVELKAPQHGTRPTTDRTKEAIFSRLDSWGVLENSRILDLYAGTGALGIEALSRGARELVSVESASAAAGFIEQSFASLKRSRSWVPELRAQLVRQKVERFVPALQSEPAQSQMTALPGENPALQVGSEQSSEQQGVSPHQSVQPALAPFDVIFIDPPYALTTAECEDLLVRLLACGMADRYTIIVLERSVRSQAPQLPQGLQLADLRNYGETAVYYIESAAAK